ncbi:MAG: phosphoenolpyruvate carboxylase [Myxococcales bacterium]
MNDLPLIEDIRFLGRILGDVIREQEGEAAFALVERVRRLSVAYRRRGDTRAGRALDQRLRGLSLDGAISVIRAFSYFSHLANLAEDVHQLRRLRHLERLGTAPEGSLTQALTRLEKRGLGASAVHKLLADAHLSPVLTAHPSEVQRKSVLDAERDVFELLLAREALPARPERLHAENEAQIRARVVQLSADQAPAQHPAFRRRRDRERPVLLPGHVLPGRARALPRPGPDARGAGAALPAPGQLDRRGPRRQPQRERRHLRGRARPPGGDGGRALPRGGAPAGRRASRCPSSSPACRPRCASWPSAPATPPSAAATSPTAARWWASTRGSRRRCAS